MRYVYEIRDWESGETIKAGKSERMDLLRVPEIKELVCELLKDREEVVLELLVFSKEAMEYYGMWKIMKLEDPTVLRLFDMYCNVYRICLEPLDECYEEECCEECEEE